MRRRTTPTAAQAKAVGTTEVVGATTPHQAGRRTSPLATSADAATRWGIEHVSATRSLRRSRRISCKTKRRGHSFS
jgi:hypothetical protein